MFGIYDGVSFILGECSSPVEAIGDALHLFIGTGSGICCYHSRGFTFIVSRAVFVIDDS
ncbi:hypothetical protein SDC9_202130 [bioreactor metagenome]|uniref:Uncharacterized protein n=1 Tax=bioreactor metagenome TaxID=1076179 RepID=A0A645IU91_9ZZZZ